MKIVIPTIGSRGDVQPFIALAQGLSQTGHHCVVASHPIMRNLVESHGVVFLPVGPDIDLAKRVAEIRSRSRNTAAGLVQAMRFGFEMLEQSHAGILAACQGADLIVVPTAVAAGKNEAELLGLPYLSVTLMPWAIPWDDPERPIAKRLVYKFIDWLAQLITTRPLNRIRKTQGLPPVGKEGFASPILNLVPVSPKVFPPNPLWDPHHRVVGYWFALPPTGWEPSQELLRFIENGEPPVLVSLGAMSLGDDDSQGIVRLFIEAIQGVEARAIIQGWEAVISKITLPRDIYAAASLPHSWLLPKCRGLVHHGGFGTTAAGFHAGIPALVIPHIADQFYWGQKVFELGAGPRPIRRAKLDMNTLTEALSFITRNEPMREAATQLGKTIRSEAGIQNAVRLIEEKFARSKISS